MRRVLFSMVLLMLIAAACAPQATATEQESIIVKRPTATPTRVPMDPTTPAAATPTHVRVDLTPAQRAAFAALSDKLSLPADKITLISAEAVTWPDGCLGVVRMGVMCTQAEVPGFKIVLEANGQKYEFHTNQDGSVAQLAEGAQNADATEQEVIKQLAANLHLQESDISVISNEVIEFRDGCLGIAMQDVKCPQVITPGRIIVLEANGVQYEYHTNENGSRVQPATLALIWKRSGGIAGFCDTLTVFLSGEVYATKCKPQVDGKMGTLASLLSPQEQKQFMSWITTFGKTKLDTSDPKGVADRMEVTLDLLGTGNRQPAKAEQQALFEFAQNLYKELSQ